MPDPDTANYARVTSGGEHDCVVVGGGHNALVCAVYLARAGRRPLVLEASDRLGGAVLSEELTLPGFVHDVFSTNQNTFLGGPVFRDLGDDLRRHGLRHATSDRPFANLYPGGEALRVYRDRERTLAELRARDPRDAEGFEQLHALFERFAPTLFELLGVAMPSGQLAARLTAALVRLRPLGATRLAQLLLASTRELGDLYFASREAKAMLATWGMHLDFGPDVSGGAMFPFLEVFSDMQAGMSIAEGGASRTIDALASLLHELGGTTRTGAEVTRLETADGRVRAVEIAGGERVAAGRAVVASVTPQALYERLLAGDPAVPDDVRRAAARFEYGPGTMMIHLALREPPRWLGPDDLGGFAYLHIPPYVEDLAETYTAAVNGLLPASPLLVVGQTSAVDPTRAPEGQAVLWVQVRALPARIRGDAAGEIAATDWDEAAGPVADRVMAKLEEYAPGIGALVLERAVLSPADLERRNRNLVGGDSVSGSHHLRQNFLFRPLPGWSTYRTPVAGLYVTGASTWPGGGVTGLPGRLAAQRVLADAESPARRALAALRGR